MRRFSISAFVSVLLLGISAGCGHDTAQQIVADDPVESNTAVSKEANPSFENDCDKAWPDPSQTPAPEILADYEKIRKEYGTGLLDVRTDFGEERKKAWYRHAESGCPYALTLVACDQYGTVKRFSLFEKAAEAGSPFAKVILGECCRSPTGNQGYLQSSLRVYTNYTRAFSLFRCADSHGEPLAKPYLAICYHDGRGVDADMKKAVSLLQEYQKNHPDDFPKLLEKYVEDMRGEEKYSKRVKDLVSRADGITDPKEQVELGQYYLIGYHVQMIKKKAVGCFRKAAEQGDAVGRFELGLCYRYGIGVDKNLDKAIEWLRQSAEANYVPAMFALAEHHLDSRDEHISLTTARFDKAHEIAKQNLGSLFTSANRGDADSQLLLAMHLENGWGEEPEDRLYDTEEQLDDAYDQYEAAAKQGNPIAVIAKARFSKKYSESLAKWLYLDAARIGLPEGRLWLAH